MENEVRSNFQTIEHRHIEEGRAQEQDYGTPEEEEGVPGRVEREPRACGSTRRAAVTRQRSGPGPEELREILIMIEVKCS